MNKNNAIIHADILESDYACPGCGIYAGVQGSKRFYTHLKIVFGKKPKNNFAPAYRQAGE